MSHFDEARHPRGQAGNAGQFTQKMNHAPHGSLGTAPVEAPSAEEIRAADREVELRTGTREVRDETAHIIARDALTNIPQDRGTASEYPMLQGVADDPSRTWTDQETTDLHREISRLWGSPYIPFGRRARVNMLFTWALHGGDND